MWSKRVVVSGSRAPSCQTACTGLTCRGGSVNGGDLLWVFFPPVVCTGESDGTNKKLLWSSNMAAPFRLLPGTVLFAAVGAENLTVVDL